MPDTHAGKGMPIGGVIAAKDVIIPNAVGVDIGCGMVFTATNVKVCSLFDNAILFCIGKFFISKKLRT